MCFINFFLVSFRYFIKAGFTVTKKAGIAQEALQYLVKEKGKAVILNIDIGVGLGVEANITIASIRFNPAIKSDIYLKLIEKAYILLRI